MIPIANGDNGKMQIFQIEYFLAVADELSFTRGAQRVNIVQSAVSAGIKQLEHDLGSALFLRQGRSISLTQAGEALLPHARTILADIQDARDAVDASHDTVRGTVTLGTLAHLGALDMVALLSRVQHDYPEVVVKLRQTVQGTRSSLAELRSGTLDLALVSVHDSSDTAIELIPMHSEGIVFVCSSNHPLWGRKQIRLHEIADESFIDFPEGWGNRAVVDAAFSASGLSRAVRAEVISFDIALAMVRENLGVAFLPASALAPDGEPGLWSIPTSLQWKIQLARLTGRLPTAAGRVLLHEFRALASSRPTT